MTTDRVKALQRARVLLAQVADGMVHGGAEWRRAAREVLHDYPDWAAVDRLRPQPGPQEQPARLTVNDLLEVCRAMALNGYGDLPVVVRDGKRQDTGTLVREAGIADGTEYPWLDDRLERRADDHLLLETSP